MNRKIFVKLIILLNLAIIILFFDESIFGQPYEQHPASKFRCVKLFEKQLPGETMLTVRAFDLKHKNNKNAVAVCGKKIYIFSPRGTLLFQNKADIFVLGTWQIRVAKLSKDGYYDNIVVSDGETTAQIFDRMGMKVGSISGKIDNFYNKDLNNDGCDELIFNGSAYYTQDGGITWDLLWHNRKLTYHMDDIKDWGNEGGLCCNRYSGNPGLVFAIDRNGNIIFKNAEIYGGHVRCLVAGNFTGSGIKDNIAVPTATGIVYILSKTGKTIRRFETVINGEAVNMSEPTEILAGKLVEGNITDEIVLSGRRGLAAFDANGKVLWSYFKGLPGGRVDDLYLSDLDGDGKNEIIAGKWNVIIILSNEGILIDKVSLTGELSKWKSDRPTVDVADINNDGYPEIMAVTDEGYFYIIGIKKDKTQSVNMQ